MFEPDRELLRQALTSESNGRVTINIARQIGRALKFEGGFALTDNGGNSKGRGHSGDLTQQGFELADIVRDVTNIDRNVITVCKGHSYFCD